MTEWAISEGRLVVGGRVVDLPLRVAQVLPVESGYVIRLDVPVGRVFNRNVYLIDRTGNEKWQIVESPHDTAGQKPYVAISLSVDGELIAGNWNGVDYAVDIRTGEIRPVAFRR